MIDQNNIRHSGSSNIALLEFKATARTGDPIPERALVELELIFKPIQEWMGRGNTLGNDGLTKVMRGLRNHWLRGGR